MQELAENARAAIFKTVAKNAPGASSEQLRNLAEAYATAFKADPTPMAQRNY